VVIRSRLMVLMLDLSFQDDSTHTVLAATCGHLANLLGALDLGSAVDLHSTQRSASLLCTCGRGYRSRLAPASSRVANLLVSRQAMAFVGPIL
jgi:hypothetical protein